MTKYLMELLLKHQHNTECCAPIACLHAVELLARREGKNRVFSHMYVYYMARKMQGTLPLEKCQLRSVFLALEKYGACSDQMWQYDKNRINTEPTDDAIFEGIQHRLLRYESVENIDDYLKRNIPVIIGMSVGEMFIYSPDKYIPVNGTSNKPIYSHAALIINSVDTGWVLANSFGPKWGNKGYCILPYECSVDIVEKYAITSFCA